MNKKFLKLIIVFTMIIGFTTQSIFLNANPVGAYQSNYTTNYGGGTQNPDDPDLATAGLVAMAEAVGIAYAAGYIAGRVAWAAWNYFGDSAYRGSTQLSAQYNPTDFSKFDIQKQ